MKIPPRHPKAFLFDMDGTLYDSMPNHARAWYRMVSELGIDADPDEFFLYEGATGAATINMIYRRAYGHDATPEQIERHYARKSELFKAMGQPLPMPGARRLVDAVMALPWKPTTILVTGSGQGSLLDRLDIDYPSAFPRERRITSRDVIHGKPHPEPFLKAAALAGASPEECVVIENAPLGVESAHKAGTFTVAVRTGPIPVSELEKAGADIVYGSMEECALTFPELLKDGPETHIH